MTDLELHLKVLLFIQTIRDSFKDAERVYSEGSCFRFYLILKHLFPDAVPYYDMNHVITKIGDAYYDIHGQVPCINHEDMRKYPELLTEAIKWRYEG